MGKYRGSGREASEEEILAVEAELKPFIKPRKTWTDEDIERNYLWYYLRYKHVLNLIAYEMPTSELNPEGEEQAAHSMQFVARTVLESDE